MPFHIELHPGRHMVLATFGPEFKPDEIRPLLDELVGKLDLLDHPVYYVANVGDMQLDLGDIMKAVAMSAQGTNPPLRHPNIIETLVVTDVTTLARAARGLESPLFGRIKIKVFATLDEALAYVDAQVAENAG